MTPEKKREIEAADQMARGLMHEALEAIRVVMMRRMIAGQATQQLSKALIGEVNVAMLTEKNRVLATIEAAAPLLMIIPAALLEALR